MTKYNERKAKRNLFSHTITWQHFTCIIYITVVLIRKNSVTYSDLKYTQIFP